MSNTLQTVTEYLPATIEVAGVMAGAATGAVADVMAQRQIAQDRQAIAGELDGVALEAERVSFGQRAKVLGKATLVWAGAGLGLLNVMAWAPEGAESDPPFIGVVVDHSGATDIGEDSPRKFINELTAKFDNDDYEAQAFVAGNSVVRSMEPSEVPKDVPFGDAPMEQGFTTALDTALELKRKSQASTERNAAIVFITNANEPGAPDARIAAAKAANIPVFIANVDEEPAPETEQNFERIAKETGGKFWGVDSENVDQITEDIQETLVKNQLTQETTNRWPQRAMAAGLTAAAMMFGYRRRKEEPTQYELTEEDL